ncbi:unnamed protein product [Candidula unifasciata]|uniref:Uncharacterized protein n=1 Tax=Candidula unifasciata TaxID=100452 RepID=A0A8S3Z705_9EUPU|nr:unnamed protein product [Candidula unifasciata]
MFSSKTRKNASKAKDGHSSTIPRPSDIAKSLATPPASQTSSSSKGHALPHSLTSGPSSVFSFEEDRTPLVHNPYDDLSLYTTQINAVHKPQTRPHDNLATSRAFSNQGQICKTPGGYFGFNKPPDSIPARYSGHDKPSGYHGFNKPRTPEVHVPSDHFGYNTKPAETSKDSRFYGSKSTATLDGKERHEFVGHCKPKSSEVPGQFYYSNQKTETAKRQGHERAKSVEPSGYYGHSNPPQVSSVVGDKHLFSRGQYGYNFDRDLQQRQQPDFRGTHSRDVSSHQKIVSPVWTSETPPSYTATREPEKEASRYERSHADNDWSNVMASTDTVEDDHIYEYTCFPQSNMPFYTSTPNRHHDWQPRDEYGSPVDSHCNAVVYDRPLRVQCDILKRLNDRSQSLSPISHHHLTEEASSDTTGSTHSDSKIPAYGREYQSPYLDSPSDDRLFSDGSSNYDNTNFVDLRSKGHRQDNKDLAQQRRSHGLTATMNYHQQLRRELGMPQHQVPHYTQPVSSSPYRGPYSNIITPLPSSSDSSIHLSSTRPMSPTEKCTADYINSLANERNGKRYPDAFQSLHGHYSTPHLPSAIMSQFEQPLSGSDPNLQSESRQSEMYTYYDNLTSPRTRSKLSASHPFHETKAFVEQYNPNFLQSRSALPKAAHPLTSDYSSSSSYRPSPQSLSSSLAPSSAASASAQHSYYSSPSVQGLCTLPRTKSPSPCPPSNSIYSLQRREPSYEEIENILPHKAVKDHPDQKSAKSLKLWSKPTVPDDKPKPKPPIFKVKKGIFGSVSEKAQRFEQVAAEQPVSKEVDKERPYRKIKDAFGDSKQTPHDPKEKIKGYKEDRITTSTSSTTVTSSPLATSCVLSTTLSSSSSSSSSRMSNPEETSKLGSEASMTSSMHESGSVDVDAFSDFLQNSCTYPYHLFSRRKKPLPGKLLSVCMRSFINLFVLYSF